MRVAGRTDNGDLADLTLMRVSPNAPVLLVCLAVPLKDAPPLGGVITVFVEWRPST